jgi:hypothetical protein
MLNYQRVLPVALGGRSGASSSGGSAARGGNTGRPGRGNIEDPGPLISASALVVPIELYI